MYNDFGRIAHLFCAIGMTSMLVSQTNTVTAYWPLRAYVVRSCEDPVWSDKGASAEEPCIVISGVQAYLPGP